MGADRRDDEAATADGATGSHDGGDEHADDTASVSDAASCSGGPPTDEELRQRARRHRREAREHEPGPDDGFADPAAYLSDGFGPVVSLYVESRTGGRFVEFTPEEYGGIEEAMNHWLACYAAARDGGDRADYAPEYTVREAAKLLIDTHSAREAADVLMGFRG